MAKVEYKYPANKELGLKSGSINEIIEKGHKIKYIFRACAVCIICKQHAAIFKNTKLCGYLCTRSYKNILNGKDEIIY